MNLREYLKKEQEKMNGYTTRKKAEYILEYYWLWILGLVVGVGLLGFVIWRAAFTVKENWFFAVFANTREEAGNHSDLWKGYVEYTGFDTLVKNVEFNDSSYFDPSVSGGTNNSYFQSFVAFVESGTLDAVTMERESLTVLGSTGRLLDLTDEKCMNLYEKYKDRLVYTLPLDEDYSESEVPVGIDVSDSILVTQYHMYDGDCVLGIGAYTQHIDAVELFLEYILKE